MKDLTQYKWAVSEALFNLAQGHVDVYDTIKRLMDIESHALENVKHKKGAELWFRLFKGDTGAYDIRDIRRIFTTDTKNNREFIIESINIGTSLGNEIFVYLS